MNYYVLSLLFRGESGIRTRGTLLEYTHFPGVLLKPLGHLSSAFPTPPPNLKSLPKVQHFFIRKTKKMFFLLYNQFNCLNHSFKASSHLGWIFA